MAVKISAGVLIVFNYKVLMAHATNAPWWHSYTPPKGGVEGTEKMTEAGARELLEEVGIKVDIKKFEEKIIIDYTDKKGSTYKTVFLFVYRIDSLSEIGLTSETVPFGQLQKEEVDEARFMDEIELHKKCLPRYLNALLPYVQNKI